MVECDLGHVSRAVIIPLAIGCKSAQGHSTGENPPRSRCKRAKSLETWQRICLFSESSECRPGPDTSAQSSPSSSSSAALQELQLLVYKFVSALPAIKECDASLRILDLDLGSPLFPLKGLLESKFSC